MTTPATITEHGNGFPEVGDYVPGDDGELYRIVAFQSRISTQSAGQGNTIQAELELADWDDCDEDDVHSASATLHQEDEDIDERDAMHDAYLDGPLYDDEY